MKRRIFVILKWALLLYLLYLAAGALLPFVHTKKTGEEFKNNFEPASFYSETESVDRARVVETSMDALESRVLMIHQAEKRIVLSTLISGTAPAAGISSLPCWRPRTVA